MSKDMFIANTLTGKVAIIPISKFGDIAVHHDIAGDREVPDAGFTVSHAPSGWAIATGINSIARAESLASKSSEVAEWSLLKIEVLRPRRGSRVAVKSSIPARLNLRMSAVIREWRAAR